MTGVLHDEGWDWEAGTGVHSREVRLRHRRSQGHQQPAAEAGTKAACAHAGGHGHNGGVELALGVATVRSVAVGDLLGGGGDQRAAVGRSGRRRPEVRCRFCRWAMGKKAADGEKIKK
jgi:hypothetical protein